MGYAVVGALGIVCSAACGKSKGSKKEAPGTTDGRRVHGLFWWFFLGWASPRIPTLFATLPGLACIPYMDPVGYWQRSNDMNLGPAVAPLRWWFQVAQWSLKESSSARTIPQRKGRNALKIGKMHLDLLQRR